MNWFDTHAAGVQAIASMASLAIAVVLAVLTGVYVRLTREIAKASADQLAFLRESVVANRKQQAAALASLAQRLRTPLAGLQLAHDPLFRYSQLISEDIQLLEALARTVDSEAANLASKAAVPLRTVLGLVEHARLYSVTQGWMPNSNDRAKWQEAHPAALGRLDDLVAHSRQVAV